MNEILQRRFRERLPVRLHEIEIRLNRLEECPADHGVLLEIMRGFHSLAGIGGTYGCHDLTARARVSELICLDVLEGGRTVSAADVAILREAVLSLATAA